jgi:hypothetical protein
MGFNRNFAASMIAFAAATLFLTSGFPIAAEVPCEIVIENEGYKKDIKGPVAFNHQQHSEDYGIQCEECHHEYQDGKNIWQEGMEVKKCIACHDPQKKQGNADRLNNAFHKNCRNCHKDIKDDDKAPYRKCSGCHQ